MITISDADLADAITDVMNELSELFEETANRSSRPDPRAWQQLLTYAPEILVLSRANLIIARELGLRTS